MESVQNNIDKIVRSKRRIQNIAVISAVFTCILAVLSGAANYQLDRLNKNEFDRVIAQKNQIQNDARTAADIQHDLNQSKSQVKRLKEQLNAEKKITLSLKRKLTETLQLLAQPRQTSDGNHSNAPSNASVTPNIKTDNTLNIADQPVSTPSGTTHDNMQMNSVAVDKSLPEDSTGFPPKPVPDNKKDGTPSPDLIKRKNLSDNQEMASEPDLTGVEKAVEPDLKGSEPSKDINTPIPESKPSPPVSSSGSADVKPDF